MSAVLVPLRGCVVIVCVYIVTQGLTLTFLPQQSTGLVYSTFHQSCSFTTSLATEGSRLSCKATRGESAGGGLPPPAGGGPGGLPRNIFKIQMQNRAFSVKFETNNLKFNTIHLLPDFDIPFAVSALRRQQKVMEHLKYILQTSTHTPFYFKKK